MPGKRTRPIEETVHCMTLVEEPLLAEGLPLLSRFCAPSTPRQIVGFSPNVPFEIQEDKVHLPADLAHVKPSWSPKSARPTSGLECLLRSQRVSGTTSTLPGSVILSVDPNEGVQSTKKEHVCVHTTFGGKIESYHQHMETFQNNLKHDHPVHIFQPKIMKDELCTQIQEHKIGEEKFPNDRSVALSEQNMLPLRTRLSELVQESYVDNNVEKYEFDLLFSFLDQSKHAETNSYATLDFMKACFMCKRRLGHGLDIYMYRGDKAFCSTECRNSQIIFDERAERGENCSSGISLSDQSSTRATRSDYRNRAANTVSAA